MGVIKRNKAVNFNSSDVDSIDSTNESISFNRFLNSSNRTSTSESTHPTFPSIASSEDEQQTNANCLLEFIDSELRRSRKSPKKRRVTRPQNSFVCLGVKGKSEKKKKRYENANLLTNPYLKCLINEADIYRELDIHDFVQKSSLTPFTILFMDQNKMKTWNNFISLSEDDQETVLKELDEEERPKNRFSKDDERKQQCANSGQRCFDRINSCIKSVLRKKKIPLNLMESIEQELLLHFLQEDADSIYQIRLDSSYARLLLHACAQFHDLNCRSFDKDGDRYSQVSKKSDHFEPSIVSLTSHLENLYFESSKK